MATSKFYLDTRRENKHSTYPLKLLIGFKGKYFYISLSINLQSNQWDYDKERIINHPNKLALNAHIVQQKNDIDFFILQHAKDFKDASELKKAIERDIFNKEEKSDDNNTLFKHQLESFISDKKKSTQDLYKHTLKRIYDYINNDNLKLEDITYDWLVSFENYLSQTANKNARNIHLRNIRAVFNHAISNDIPVKYPFKKFKIRPVPTAKRSLTVDELRTLFNYPVKEYAQIHLEMFKLIFYLIGINIIDLFSRSLISTFGRNQEHRL
ncbi:MAG: phage integrase SAM-like domain-containing protein, partial [Candidatus Aphodosoma sp.]